MKFKNNFSKILLTCAFATLISVNAQETFAQTQKLKPKVLPDSVFSGTPYRTNQTQVQNQTPKYLPDINSQGRKEALTQSPSTPQKTLSQNTPSQNTFKETQPNTNLTNTKNSNETYKDANGNPISKEQKELSSALKKKYKKVTKQERIMEALELMQGGLAAYSRQAILGNNLTNKPISIDFEDLSKFGEAYSNFDALGWKKKERLYIYINKKHSDAPAPALAAVLAHEALHQDDFNSLNEETYAWTLEAAVWTQLSEKNPKYSDSLHPLVVRENTLKKLFIKGNYTNKYIKKTVYSNPGYANLPSRSPGFEDDSL